ncbi:MAG: hypothetical protein CVV02_14325 [Firmicutes bacterium HGW-Firmicutes-7]|nr:MAG: hypothetical protein CVV02_14325 [Firmicutes bacterium HGW-Firmicutes-7]
MKNVLKILMLSIFVLVLLVGCQSKEKQLDDEDNNQKESSEDGVDVEKESDSKENESDSNEKEKEALEEEANALALDFSLSDGRGNTVDLGDYKDKFVFLNFFTTWCGYCMEEMPEFQSVYNQYKDDVEIIIVNVNFDPGEKSVDKVVEWYEEEGYTFPMLIDEDGEQTKAFYPYVTGYPTTFVYAKGGNYLGYISGGLNEESMKEIIEKYMDK